MSAVDDLCGPAASAGAGIVGAAVPDAVTAVSVRSVCDGRRARDRARVAATVTLRNRWRRIRASEPMRDATPAELADELELVLEAIVDGELGATSRTVELARVELEHRRADVARRHGGGLAAGGGER